MEVLLESFKGTDDYRVHATLHPSHPNYLTHHPTRVVAVAWCHRNPKTKGPGKKTWAIYHIPHGGGPVAANLSRAQVRRRLRQLARAYLSLQPLPVGAE